MPKAQDRYLTLESHNQFEFHCPTFDADTKMRQCMALREAVWAGKEVEKRQGCQAAMRCGMCPAAAIVSKIIYSTGEVSDDYGSLEPKKGKLHADILDRVKNVVAPASWLQRYNLSERERDLIHTAGRRVAEQLKTAPGAGKFIAPKQAKGGIELRSAPQPIVKEADATQSAINKAAATGDMSAALNVAA